jgi:hypothetical protein
LLKILEYKVGEENLRNTCQQLKEGRNGEKFFNGYKMPLSKINKS